MIVFVAGCRPNFVKMAPLIWLFKKNNIPFLFCHTQQHYDYLMSKVFIEEFQLPEPDFYGVENIPKDADYVIVFGDVNSSREAAEYAYLKGIKIIHIESGLRSFDKSMPEELNRIKIDHISDYLFITESTGVDNLMIEEAYGKGFLIGNTMIDTLNIMETRFVLLTLHRPSNVDDPVKLHTILATLDNLNIKIAFPKHHRVKLEKTDYNNISIMEPMAYSDFVDHLKRCSLVITDSGGVQEEAAWLGRRCLTLRDNTERPITLRYGNQLSSLETIYDDAKSILQIPLWDGKAAERIFEIMKAEGII